MKKTRSELLQEALLLEQLGSEWEVSHAAAFCTCSESYIYRSTCPRVSKDSPNSIKGKRRIRFAPADVKRWNASRSHPAEAA